MARIIAVVSGKGGVGKTTIAANLGAIIAQYFKKQVTVVDCNITTSHLGLYLGIYYHPVTLNKVLRNEETIHDATYQHFTGMYIVPSSHSLSELQGVDVTRMRNKIRMLNDKNDIIILDSAPGLGREALACLKSCDEVLYVTMPFVPMIMDIVKYQEVVQDLDIKSLGIIVNMSDNKKHEMTNAEIEELVGLPVVANIPHDKNIRKALSERIPFVVQKPYSKASKELHRFAGEIVGEKYEQGMLNRILERLRIG